MNDFTLYSYEEYPEDQYTKAVCILSFNTLVKNAMGEDVTIPHHCAYVKKLTKQGNYFWSAPSIGVTKDGQKTYVDGHAFDSKILDKKVTDYLTTIGITSSKASPSAFAQPLQPSATTHSPAYGTAMPRPPEQENLPF